MLYRIEDPVANTTTKWDTGSKEVKVIEWPQSASVENASRMKCPGACDETETDQAGNVVEKLGTKTIGGFITEGTRVSYAVPAGRDKNNQPIVVVQESWYCPELKITIVEIYDDPRNGTSSNELIDIVRGEPDATQYEAPADYPVRKVQMHLQ